MEVTLRVVWTTQGGAGEGRTWCCVEGVGDECRLAEPGYHMELWEIRMFFSLSSLIAGLFAPYLGGD